MSSPKAAPRAAASNVAASLAALLSPARAEASRKNGARSHGPKTPEGKARASKNALKHGFRAEKHALVEGECAKTFAAFEAELVGDLAPEGALQSLLAGRIVRAAWRLERAERIETELFAREMKGLFDHGDLGLALIKDGNGARAFDVLLRYRGAAQAELFRTLRTLKALQAEAEQETAEVARGVPPNEPKARANAGESQCAADLTAISQEPEAPVPAPAHHAADAPIPGPSLRVAARAPRKQLDEPESPGNPRDSSDLTAQPNGSASLLAGTALTLPGRRNEI